MRFTIKAKLSLAFGIIILLFAAAGYLSINSLSSSNDRMQAFASKPFIQVQRVMEMEKIGYDAARMIARSVAESTTEARLKLQKDFKVTDAQLRGVLKDYGSQVEPAAQDRVCTAVRKPSSGAPAFVPARAA